MLTAEATDLSCPLQQLQAQVTPTSVYISSLSLLSYLYLSISICLSVYVSVSIPTQALYKPLNFLRPLPSDLTVNSLTVQSTQWWSGLLCTQLQKHLFIHKIQMCWDTWEGAVSSSLGKHRGPQDIFEKTFEE